MSSNVEILNAREEGMSEGVGNGQQSHEGMMKLGMEKG